jgi:multidrug resistance efflux pump
MDDVVEQKQLEAAQTRADIREEIRAREADLKVKAIQFERTKEAKANGAATQAEYDQREAEKVQAEIAIDRQKHEGKIAEADAAVAAQRIKQMKLVSPIDGFVQRIDNDEGEGVDPQRPVMVVVQLDPLDVEIKSLTSDEVAGLRLGQGVKVRYRGENDWVDAKVKFISPVIDARSGTQVIKLALPNPKNTYAGRQVEVQLPSNVAAGSAGGGADAAAAR